MICKTWALYSRVRLCHESIRKSVNQHLWVQHPVGRGAECVGFILVPQDLPLNMAVVVTAGDEFLQCAEL